MICNSTEEEELREDLADLTTEIAIKEKLIEELEQSQKKIHVLKTQYEKKLNLLQNKIRETEEERDHVLQNMKQKVSELVSRLFAAEFYHCVIHDHQQAFKLELKMIILLLRMTMLLLFLLLLLLMFYKWRPDIVEES